MNISMTIKTILKQRGLSQAQLSRLLGYKSPMSISHMISRNAAMVSSILAICDTCGYDFYVSHKDTDTEIHVKTPEDAPMAMRCMITASGLTPYQIIKDNGLASKGHLYALESKSDSYMGYFLKLAGICGFKVYLQPRPPMRGLPIYMTEE